MLAYRARTTAARPKAMLCMWTGLWSQVWWQVSPPMPSSAPLKRCTAPCGCATQVAPPTRVHCLSSVAISKDAKRQTRKTLKATSSIPNGKMQVCSSSEVFRRTQAGNRLYSLSIQQPTTTRHAYRSTTSPPTTWRTTL